MKIVRESDLLCYRNSVDNLWFSLPLMLWEFFGDLFCLIWLLFNKHSGTALPNQKNVTGR